MKKAIAVLLATAMTAASLAGCGSSSTSGSTTAAASQDNTTAAAQTTQATEAATETSGDSLELKIGVSTAETDPRNIAAEEFAKEISEKTSGAITAKVYPSGQLGGDADLINSMALDSGTVDIIITDASNFATYDPLMGISALPFNFADFETAWKFMDSDIEAEAEAGLVEQNMRVLAHYCNGFRCVTNSKGAINSPDDMKGMLIRTPENPVIMATMTALGANPQPLSFSELYQALQQGTYDAQENPIPVIYNNKLYEVQKYLSVTNHIYSGMCFTIAESTWNKLTDEQKEIVEAAAKSSAETDRKTNEQQTNDLVAKLKEAGMEINEPDLAPFQEATKSVYTDNASTYGDLMDKLNTWKAENAK